MSMVRQVNATLTMAMLVMTMMALMSVIILVPIIVHLNGGGDSGYDDGNVYGMDSIIT